MAWSNRLSRPIAIKGAKRLLTLRDAAGFVQASFKPGGQFRSSSQVLNATIEELIAAAESGDPGDIDIATAQVETLLSHEGLVEPGTLKGDIAAKLRALLERDARRRKS